MKRIKLLTLLTVLLAANAFAQNSNPWPTTDNVGIGTASPAYPLEVSKSVTSNYAARIANNNTTAGTSYGLFINGGTNNSDYALNINNAANSATLFTVSGEGKVGVGNTSPAQKLDVAGAIQTSGDAGIVLANSLNSTYGSSTVYGYISRSGGSGSVYPWNSNGTVVMQASSYGGTGGFAFMTGDSPSVKMSLLNNGNLGIGTNNPFYKMQVEGSGTADETVGWFNNQGNYSSRLAVRNSNSTAYLSQAGSTGDNIASGLLPGSLHLGVASSVSPIQFWNGSSPAVRMTVATNGNVGIGTTSPDEKLTVAGNIHSREIKVTTTAGADFVFEKDYKLRSLSETENFIKQNKHLPEIASASEMIKDGIKLGDMNVKLLQKIEELTLYLIEQNKDIKALKDSNDHLKSEINQLKSKH